MYVLAIDVVPTTGPGERTVWRFSEDRDKAESTWYRAREYAESGRIARDGKDRVQVVAVRLYETTSSDRATARDLVVRGEANALKDSDNALIGLSQQQIGTLDELLRDVPDDKASP